MRPLLVSLVAALALVGFAAASPASDPAGADLDCADFDSQNEAQAFFESHDPGSDPHALDGDGDGAACETLPCPCAGDGGRGRI